MPRGSQSPAAARAIVLGASNVELYRRRIVARLRAALPAPLELHLVCGLGRSYGLPSLVLGRELPSIASCGLWQALARAPRVPTVALLADVGNDLAYGAPWERVLEWVEEALARLAALEAKVALVGLPLDSLRALSPPRFALFRALFFPGRKLRRAPLVEAAAALESALVAVARARGLAHVAARPEWFGFDPIHLRPRRADEALAAWLASVDLAGPPRAPASSERRALARARPARACLFGRERLVPQPCVRFEDGGSFSWW